MGLAQAACALPRRLSASYGSRTLRILGSGGMHHTGRTDAYAPSVGIEVGEGSGTTRWLQWREQRGGTHCRTRVAIEARDQEIGRAGVRKTTRSGLGQECKIAGSGFREEAMDSGNGGSKKEECGRGKTTARPTASAAAEKEEEEAISSRDRSFC
jgi:hypothetical protein